MLLSCLINKIYFFMFYVNKIMQRYWQYDSSFAKVLNVEMTIGRWEKGRVK